MPAIEMPELPWEGGCRCGRVRFRIDARPLLTMACHCSGCQRMTASAFSTTVMIPAVAFAVTAGDPVIGGMHDDRLRHNHCDWCKSWLFTRIDGRDFVNVRATAIDGAAGWFAPFVESFVSEALPWAVGIARHRFDRFPEPHEYPALLAEFAAG